MRDRHRARGIDDAAVQQAVADVVDVCCRDDEGVSTARRPAGARRCSPTASQDGRCICNRRRTVQVGWPWDAAPFPDGETVRLPGHAGRPPHRSRRRAAPGRLRRVRHGDVDPASATRRSPGPTTRASCCQLFTVLEDLRVDAAVPRRYPGAHADLAPSPRRLPPSAPAAARRPARRHGRLAAPGFARRRHRRPRRRIDHAGRRPAARRPARAGPPLRATGATAADSVRVAVAIGALIDDELPFDGDDVRRRSRRPTPTWGPEAPGDRPRGGDVPRPPSDDLEHGDELTRPAGQIVEVLAPDPGKPEAERPEGPRPPTRVPAHRRRPRHPGLPLRRVGPPRRRYLRSWCRVLEQRLHGDDTVVHR